MSDRNLVIGVAVLLLVLGGVLYVTGPNSGSKVVPAKTPEGNLDMSAPEAVLAQCLKDSGAVFYGAFWCPHCQKQKAEFGLAESLLPYVECSTPDQRSQTPICIEKKIESYPTWEFKDGSRQTGEVSLKDLAEKTSCAYPGAKVSTTNTVSSAPNLAPTPQPMNTPSLPE